MNRENQLKAFERLLDIMDELREKCPWDHKQTMESLRPNTIEEVYELSDAVLAEDLMNISKELGDVLLHVVFYAKIGAEKGSFDIADVCNRLCDKLVYRHPHIYGETAVSGADDVVKNWEQLKQKEKDGNKTILSGIPAGLPSLIKAYRMQDKARNAGFDWEQKEDVWDKVREELGEFEFEANRWSKVIDDPSNDAATREAARDTMEREFGDLLFSLINAARLYKIKPDNALEKTNQKFQRRFTYVEQQAKLQGKRLDQLTLGEMDALWDEAKGKGL